MTTTEVDNWPGDAHGLLGPALMERMKSHAERFNTEIINDHIHTVDFSKRPFALSGDYGTYTCDALIIATGASAKYLGIPSEEKFRGKGVSACATCDGFFFKGHRVAVVGGGNTAVEEALYLTNLASHVTVVHRRDKFRAEKILQDRLFALEKTGKVRIAWNHTVDEIVGDDSGVNGVHIKPTQHGGTIETLDVTGAFIAIGHTPNTGIFAGQLDMRDGYIVIKSWRGRGGHRPPAFPEYSPLATSPITCIVRPSHPPVLDAWLRSMRTNTSTSITDIDPAAWDALEPTRLAVPAPCFSRRAGERRLRWTGRPAGSRRPSRCTMSAAWPRQRRRTSKAHSLGEFVFDLAWAHAYAQHGLAYYPKLVLGVPFTPATGARLLIRPDLDPAPTRALLIAAIREFAAARNFSSIHGLFVAEEDRAALGQRRLAGPPGRAVPLAQPRLPRLRSLPRGLHGRQAQEGQARTSARRRGRHRLRNLVRPRAGAQGRRRGLRPASRHLPAARSRALSDARLLPLPCRRRSATRS